MHRATAQFEKWVSVSHPAPLSSVRLACLPYAGGSASFFFPVSRALHPSVEVLALQHPGRQTRLHEPRIDNVPEFADQIFAALRHLDDKPLALFGHSMGAVLAYEVALRMQDAGLPAPVRLFASGRRAPSRGAGGRVHTGSDAELVSELGVERNQRDAARRPGGAGDDPAGHPQRLHRHRTVPARARPTPRLPGDRAHRRQGPPGLPRRGRGMGRAHHRDE
ncbi:thioesterase II family protein [Streptomyces asoensis]|uniref:thioesterase II family protein n=1 Tax=Streptomyces asoensis TaxID=249586 RepID=UPI0033F1464D